MSLVAMIYCKCVEEGKALKPPFDQQLLTIEADGRSRIQLPEGAEKQTLNRDKYTWEQSCCSHPWRHYLNEWICDWRGVKMLRQALTDIGAKQFSVLLESIPLINAGQMNVAECEKALQELAVFKAALSQGQFMLASLQTASDGVELSVNSAKVGQCIYFSDGYELWLSGQGVKLLQHNQAEPIFQSMHFAQALEQDKTDAAKTAQTLLKDKATGKELRINADIRLQDVRNGAYPPELQVVLRACEADAFDYIITPLKKAFETSVALNRPIVWG